MSTKPKLALVSWVEEGSVGVMPVSAAKDGDKLYPGSIVSMKFHRKYYEAEILKISDNKSELNKNCKDLAEFKLSREDFLSEPADPSVAEEVVSTTTESDSSLAKPCSSAKRKCEDVNPRAPKKKKSVAKTSAARVTAAKERANRMFSSMESNATTADEIHQNRRIESRTQASLRTIQEVPGAFSSSELLQMLEEQKKEIEELQNTLKLQQSDIRHSLPSTPKVRCASTTPPFKYVEQQETGIYDENFYTDEAYNPNEYWDHNITWDVTPKSSICPLSKKVNKKLEYDTQSAKLNKVNDPKKSPLQEKVELVHGYNVYVTPRQLDEAVASSGGRPTKLIRALMSIYFDNSTLASSSALGSRGRPSIDPDIRDACIKYVQSNHKEVARTSMIDAINDKCAQCRRKLNSCRS